MYEKLVRIIIFIAILPKTVQNGISREKNTILKDNMKRRKNTSKRHWKAISKHMVKNTLT